MTFDRLYVEPKKSVLAERSGTRMSFRILIPFTSTNVADRTDDPHV